MIKRIARSIIVHISWGFANAFTRRFKPHIIGVVGSVGKSGTKRSIALTLSGSKSVAWQDGNYNDLVTVPLIFFGLTAPSLFNPIAWLWVFMRMFACIVRGQKVDVVVLELGTDAPGQIAAFGKHVQLDTLVITAIEPEHMLQFKTLANVAREELSAVKFASSIYLDESIDRTFLGTDFPAYQTYGKNPASTNVFSINNDIVSVHTANKTYSIHPKLIGEHQYRGITVAIAIAESLGIDFSSIEHAVEAITPMSGRMQLLRGKEGSIIIDDSYNSSPAAAKAALNYLYDLPQAHKVAILGSMNEMGSESASLHNQLGALCDPTKLEIVITIGADANEYLAPAAKARRCTVKSFDSPFLAADYLATFTLADTALLFKGSQNGVFVEEAIKSILADPLDAKRLVRQSSSWLNIKHKQFPKVGK
ncbi:MAG: Mur ligase family protein [Candidatus Saccharibacteria bacterium]